MWNYRLFLFLVFFQSFSLLACASTQAGSGVTDSFRDECPLAKNYPSLFQSDFDLSAVKQVIEARLGKLGLTVSYQGFGAAEFSNTAEDLLRLERLASIVIPSLEKYPKAWFQKVDLKKISLVKDLHVAGQVRKAMPDPVNSTLYYSDNNDLLCLAGMEERVHHEFYHFIEYRFHGDMYYKDPDWMKFSPINFQYGAGGAAAYGIPGWQNLGHPEMSLVSAYAGFAVEEDKAEVFAWMMTEGYAARLAGWLSHDASLEDKHSFLNHFFDTASAGLMNEAFFAQFIR